MSFRQGLWFALAVCATVLVMDILTVLITSGVYRVMSIGWVVIALVCVAYVGSQLRKEVRCDR